MSHRNYLFVTVLACLSLTCVCLTPRNPYSFEPRKTDQKTTVGPLTFLETQFFCFRWKETYLENGECFEVKVEMSVRCADPAIDTFYAPCDLNVNVNSFIGFWNLRIWDYLYTLEGPSLYYMNRDGTCLQKKFLIRDGKIGEIKESNLLKPRCDMVREKWEKEVRPLDPKVVQLTWNEPEPAQTPVDAD